MWIAAHGFPGWHLLAVFTLGTFLMRSAGCCVNDVADREFDRHVKRTAQRPVTRGAVSVREALVLGAVLALVAFGLVLTTNAAAIAWSFAALAITLVYPYAKRFVSMPQAVLGIAFSFGIPMAFAAVQSRVPLLAWVLLLGNLFWVLAYDTEYAMVDRDDDLRIGMKTSAITLGRADVPVIMLCYASLPGASGRRRWRAGSRRWRSWCRMAAAAAQAVWHYLLIRDREREGCFKAFRLNHWLGFTVFAGVVAGYAPALDFSGRTRRPVRARAGRAACKALTNSACIWSLSMRSNRRLGGAALGGDALAQHFGRVVGGARQLGSAGEGRRPPGGRPGRGGRPISHAGLGHRFQEEEHIGRAGAGQGRDGVELRFVVDPQPFAGGRDDLFHARLVRRRRRRAGRTARSCPCRPGPACSAWRARCAACPATGRCCRSGCRRPRSGAAPRRCGPAHRPPPAGRSGA